MSEEDDAARLYPVRGYDRRPGEPGTHRHDVDRSCRAEPETGVARVACARRELHPRIGVPAGEAIETIVDPREERILPEPIGREVDRPQDDRGRPSHSSLQEPAGGGEWIESEP